MSTFFMRLRRLLFPPRCAACKSLLDWFGDGSPAALCRSCASLWQEEQREVCTVCALPVLSCGCMPEVMQKAKCGGLRRLCYYRSLNEKSIHSRLIYHMKNVRDADAAAFLAAALLPALRELQAESESEERDLLLTYLPRGATAKLESGTDQAEELARALSRLSGIPVCRLILRNRGKNRPQKHLSSEARLRNAKESFRISPKAALSGKTVFLVDDIVTTGAGMAVGTRLLRRAGAKEVYCLSLASVE